MTLLQRGLMDSLGQLAEAISTSRNVRDYSDVALCKDCGYRLCGLPEHRCPECGRWFTPTDPRTMKVPGWKDPSRKFIARTTYGREMLQIGLLANVCLFLGYDGSLLTIYALVLYVMMPLLAAHHLSPGPSDTDLPKGPRWRLKFFVATLITIVCSIEFDACDHGRHFRIRPFFYSGQVMDGNYCGNPRYWKSAIQLLYMDVHDRPNFP